MKVQSSSIGLFESVTFPDLVDGDWVAKIDTGAYTGALHCTKVRKETTDQGEVLHFSPFDHPEQEIKTTEFSTRLVRSSNGHVSKRYVIDTTIRLRGKKYPIRLSLADRSDMRWPVLIGRKFLRQNHLIVDTTRFRPYGVRKEAERK